MTKHETFNHLAGEWKQETAFESSASRIAMHPAYQKIIGMGPDVLPLIFKDLETDPTIKWFWALKAITHEDPIPKHLEGKMREIGQVWLEWGRRNGYLQSSRRQSA